MMFYFYLASAWWKTLWASFELRFTDPKQKIQVEVQGNYLNFLFFFSLNLDFTPLFGISREYLQGSLFIVIITLSLFALERFLCLRRQDFTSYIKHTTSYFIVFGYLSIHSLCDILI